MKKVLVLSLALILLLGIMSNGTSSYFSDTETGSGTICAWLGCPPGSMIIVSDTNTMVTEVNNALLITPQNAVPAWEPCLSYPACDTSIEDDPSLWDNSTGNYFTLTGADWIWDTRLTSDPAADAPVLGRVVRFERTFDIPCSPIGATLHMAVDNGYTVWLNGNLVGCAQVNSGGADPCIDWWTTDLTEAYVHTDGWQTVGHYAIPSMYLVVGTNTLVILAANEQLPDGTAESNPAGLIYQLEVTWGD
ncbi:MAG TPA: hypothetical protein G4N91_02450 [Dehalococcoidia bacterium]|nr:hypothetical protein [Dehalococcoidia bacterium]